MFRSVVVVAVVVAGACAAPDPYTVDEYRGQATDCVGSGPSNVLVILKRYEGAPFAAIVGLGGERGIDDTWTVDDADRVITTDDDGGLKIDGEWHRYAGTQVDRWILEARDDGLSLTGHIQLFVGIIPPVDCTSMALLRQEH